MRGAQTQGDTSSRALADIAAEGPIVLRSLVPLPSTPLFFHRVDTSRGGAHGLLRTRRTLNITLRRRGLAFMRCRLFSSMPRHRAPREAPQAYRVATRSLAHARQAALAWRADLCCLPYTGALAASSRKNLFRTLAGKIIARAHRWPRCTLHRCCASIAAAFARVARARRYRSS